MNANTPTRQSKKRKPANNIVTIDVAYYQKYLEGYDLTEAQKNELIFTIANVIMAFVDLGFDVNPEQTPCTEHDNFDETFPFTVEEMLEWIPSTQNNQDDPIIDGESSGGNA